MSCNIKFKSLDYLKSEGAIGDARVIIDHQKFKELNTALTTLAYNKYAVGEKGTMLFSSVAKKVPNIHGERRTIFRAEPNEGLFKILQTATEEYEALDYIPIQVDWSNVTSKEETNAFPDEPFVPDVEGETTVTNTLNEFILFNDYNFSKDNKTIPATKVLDNIINNYEALNPDAIDLIDRARFLLGKTQATVELVPDHEIESNAFMQYEEGANNKILVNLTKLKNASDFKTVKGFLHETFHSVTISAYNNPISIEQEMFKEFIDEAYNYFIEKSNNKQLYGYKNPIEFISEIMTNPVFINEIKSHKNYWNRFVDWIRRLFGLSTKKRVTYDNIIKSVLHISGTEQNFAEEVGRKYLIEEDDIYDIDLTKLENRLSETIQKMDESLNLSIRSLEKSMAREKDPDVEELLGYQIDIFDEVKSAINSYQKENQILAVKSFAELMSKSLTSLGKSIDRINLSDEEYVTNAVKKLGNAAIAYSILDDVLKLINDIKTNPAQSIVTEEELIEIEKVLEVAAGKYVNVNQKMKNVMKTAGKFKLSKASYFPQVIKKHKNRLAVEYNKRKASIQVDKEQWIMDGLTRDKDLIDADIEQALEELIQNRDWDMYASTALLNSSVNMSSPLIQIFNKKLLDGDNIRNEHRVEADKIMKKLFDTHVNETGSDNIKKLHKNLIDYDSNGFQYYMGEYKASVYTDFFLKMQEIRHSTKNKTAELKEKLDEHPVNSAEYVKIKDEILNHQKESNLKLDKLENKYTIKIKGNERRIKDEYKNDLSHLSKSEKATLDHFIDLQEQNSKMTWSKGDTYNYNASNIKYAYGARFYQLPKITKTDTERLWQGDIKGMATDKVRTLTQTRADDFGYIEKNTDLKGNEIKQLKIWYRDSSGTWDPKTQSLDLYTISRLDHIQAKAYEVRSDMEDDLNFIISIAKNKQYKQKSGTSKIISRLFKRYNLVDGEKSQTVKILENLMESKFYDVMNKSDTKLGKLDLNKGVSFINATSAFLTLSLNIASGTANVLNAQAQLFMESFFSGKFIKAKGIRKAHAIYGANMIEVMKDLQRPVNRAYVNQVNEMFNVRGLFNFSNADFLKNNLLKAGLNTKSLQVFQESGEHYMQSITTMSVLDGIAVMNKDRKFIDINGNVTNNRKKAASLLDMLKVDPVDGVVTLDKNVVFTTHSQAVSWNEGGKSNIDLLIYKKLYDVIGNYRKTDQPEFMRHWYGKLAMLYRKFLIPMGVARLRGIETAFIKKKNLTEGEKRFSYALQEFEEGSYTTLLRYIYTSLSEMKFYLLSQDRIWDQLTDYEKHNIKKAVIETIMTTVLVPLSELFAAMAADDDSNREKLFFVAYQLRRLDTELSQYKDFGESFKMMRSPIPSARLVETSLNVFGSIFPWNWSELGERYQQGTNKDELKFFVRLKKQIPIIKDFYRTYEDLFGFQNSKRGTGL